MTYVRPGWRWIALFAYAAGGAALGLALPAMKTFAATRFGRPGLAVFFAINIGMPLLVVTLAAAYPRPLIASAGAMLAAAAFLLAAGFVPPAPSTRFAANLLNALGPILTIACLMYPVLGIGTCLLVRPWRRVGAPPNPSQCPRCGYDLTGLCRPRCPECSLPIDARGVTE